MKTKLYLECYSGISGDMMVGALLDLGADRNVLEKSLASLSLTGFKIQISRVKKAGLDVCDFHVILDSRHENHDHDMNYLHGNGESHPSSLPRLLKKTQGHEKGHFHLSVKNHSHSHEHRNLEEILSLIEKSGIRPGAKQRAKRIFEVLARAEAKAHGVSVDEVHFHEVGAVDSIIDIVAVAVCLDNLEIDEVIVPVLYEGQGCIRCQHGIIPVPAPAVAHIVEEYGLLLQITDSQGEFVTPTGAAIVAAMISGKKLPQRFSIEKTGLGAGKRKYDRPGFLRAMLIKDAEENQDVIYKLETNIDDCSGESLGFIMEQLFEAGARDVHYLPVFMKKNRPAYQLNVICSEESVERLEKLIFEGTTTIGIRRQRMERSYLKREIKTVQTSLGPVQVKICELPSGCRVYPESSSVVEKCREHRLSYTEAYQRIQRECYEKL